MEFRGLVVLLMLVLALGNAKPVVVMILLLPAASGPFHSPAGIHYSLCVESF